MGCDQYRQAVGDVVGYSVRDAVNSSRLQAQVDLIVDVVDRHEQILRGVRNFGGEQLQAADPGCGGRDVAQRRKPVFGLFFQSHRNIDVGDRVPPAEIDLTRAVDDPEPGTARPELDRLHHLLQQIRVAGILLAGGQRLADLGRLEYYPFSAAAAGWFDYKVAAQRAQIDGRQNRLITIRRKDDGIGSVDSGIDEGVMHDRLIAGTQRQVMGIDAIHPLVTCPIHQRQKMGVTVGGSVKQYLESQHVPVEALQNFLKIRRGHLKHGESLGNTGSSQHLHKTGIVFQIPRQAKIVMVSHCVQNRWLLCRCQGRTPDSTVVPMR